MQTTMNPRRLTADQRRALRIIARAADGCTEASLLAHGFSIDVLAGFVRDGLISVGRRTLRGPGRGHVDVVWMVITDAGKEALAER
jgi:hypothetical protein